MAGLDLRLKARRDGIFIPPLCTELSGQVFSFVYDGGSTEALRIDDTVYECSKVRDALYLLIGQGAAYAIDTELSAVTRVSAEKNGTAISMGVFGDGSKRHELTQDMDGNTVMWSCGAKSEFSVTARYSGGGVSLSRTLELAELSASEFAVVSLGGCCYIQCALVRGYDEPLTVVLISDFTSNLCVGAVLGGAPRRFAGYATHL